MHPAMALWIWSVSMSRVWQNALLGEETLQGEDDVRPRANPIFIPAGAYLHSDLAKNPLPDVILDRLADLYWTERDADLAI
ncbi:hypothetical protein [Hyphomicrobium sp.]|uniref:hypothetical protein n=1 Tax=Hyphomicrobium sp. TaxID=82 RepID=UPI000FA42CBE|nr:hypothetical protein [Hyphomicrobium sp.]MBN9248373.1 hypothetical protein [Hyphomicrobium sp.]RUP11194.1 MAG: hypothetical protein EKK38_01720 [Hyphomicrobium sp.]